jgi:hypothetical protein
MRGFRFSLRGMFAGISFLAAACGLMLYATPFSASLAFCATAQILLAAVGAAFLSAGARRAFWIGFVVFGFGYAWAVCGSWQSPDGTLPMRDRLGLD